jgi:alpha-L-arabinofuranosidase
MKKSLAVGKTHAVTGWHAGSRFLQSFVLATGLTSAAASAATITVDATAPGKRVAPTMHGIFFEDINYGADGGLYAELVQNRSFEHRERMFGWTVDNRGGTGQAVIVDELPLHTNNTHYVRLTIPEAGRGMAMVNRGFDGIAVKAGSEYVFAVHARARGDYPGEVVARLEDGSGRNIGEYRFSGIGSSWHRYEGTITSHGTTGDARLMILATAEGVLDLDMVSLFPVETFKGRRNGLRADLAQLLADMKPGFMRFPGGCIVEGTDFRNMYRWKDTVGEIWERKQNWNLWSNPQSPQYHQTYGLGFFEYFQFCEDIGAEPVPVVNCGMCCQARGGRHVPVNELQPFIQDALDLIEFANGPTNTPWGAKRAAMGHPEPFHLKLLGVGNEQWQQEYFDRYDVFYRAIKSKHPEIQIITTSGPQASDDLFHFAWNKFRSGTPADIVDEHYYRAPRWFLENVDRYDTYDRKGPKVFAGEYAAHDVNRRNNLRSALAEAAFITGLWRNADVVTMAAYAPLLAKVGHVQWAPDLIWFNNANAYGSPSYHVQAMVGQHLPSVALPVRVESPMVQTPNFAGRIGVGTWRTRAEFKDIKVTKKNATLYASDPGKGLSGWETHGGDWSVTNGVLRQTADGENIRAFIGDASWSDYTLTLKARKISGSEGFLISFASRNPEEVTWWNLGGWENRQHGLEVPGGSDLRVAGQIETGRWYDIRIELNGGEVKCYLDDRLVQEAKRKAVAALNVAAGRHTGSGEYILAVANTGGNDLPVKVELKGLKSGPATIKACVLSSANEADENDFNNPLRVAPKESTATVSSSTFEHRFPRFSFTILRVTAD